MAVTTDAPTTHVRAHRGSLAGAAAVVVLLLGGVLSACSPAPVPATSKCSTNALVLTCPYRSTTLTAAGEARQVLWQQPNGVAPATGWPTVIVFQHQC